MSQETLEMNGKRFISSARAAALVGYTKDYVGQLARAGKLDARLVGRSWYVSEDSIQAHKLTVHYTLTKPKKNRANEKIEDEKTLQNKDNSFVRLEGNSLGIRPSGEGIRRSEQDRDLGAYARRDLFRSSIRFEPGESLQYEPGSYVPKLLPKTDARESMVPSHVQEGVVHHQAGVDAGSVQLNIVRSSPTRTFGNVGQSVPVATPRTSQRPARSRVSEVVQSDGVRLVTRAAPSVCGERGDTLKFQHKVTGCEQNSPLPTIAHSQEGVSQNHSKRVSVTVALVLFVVLSLWYFLSV